MMNMGDMLCTNNFMAALKSMGGYTDVYTVYCLVRQFHKQQFHLFHLVVVVEMHLHVHMPDTQYPSYN